RDCRIDQALAALEASLGAGGKRYEGEPPEEGCCFHGFLLRSSTLMPELSLYSTIVSAANFLPPWLTVILRGALIPPVSTKSSNICSISPGGPMGWADR